MTLNKCQRMGRRLKWGAATMTYSVRDQRQRLDDDNDDDVMSGWGNGGCQLNDHGVK